MSNKKHYNATKLHLSTPLETFLPISNHAVNQKLQCDISNGVNRLFYFGIMKNMRRLIRLTLLFLFIGLLFPSVGFAQQNTPVNIKEERFEAVVTKIQEEKEIEINGRKQLYQKLELNVESGNRKGNKIIIENGNIPVNKVIKYKIGEKLIITAIRNPDGNEIFYITDYVRRSPLYLLFGLFIGITALIGRKRGMASILGMVFSFFIIFSFVLPQISSGKDPIIIAIVASIFIIRVTFYLSHGFNRKTTTAIASTIIALIITGVLANIFTDAAKLTGFASEEAGFVEASKPGLVNIRGLMLAGIIIGVLGILDDITISQAAIVYQLKKTAKNLSFKELYSKAMDIGRDHIASVVNTLVLVYTGAALPLLLLFINNPIPFGDVINYEILAEEIVRTLVASIGLILAVPITTFLSAYTASKTKITE